MPQAASAALIEPMGNGARLGLHPSAAGAALSASVGGKCRLSVLLRGAWRARGASSA